MKWASHVGTMTHEQIWRRIICEMDVVPARHKHWVVLMNIVVAVLLDEFISVVAAEKANARAEEQEKRDKEKVVNAIAEGPLDALVRSLLAYTTKDDLHRRIFNLYQRVDLDQSGNLASASP